MRVDYTKYEVWMALARNAVIVECEVCKKPAVKKAYHLATEFVHEVEISRTAKGNNSAKHVNRCRVSNRTGQPIPERRR